MIAIENLVKKYGDFTAVNRISFTIEDGEILGFLGPNGAGKTTTLRTITGFLPATSGRVLVDGMDVFEKPLEIRRLIGYLPETPPLYTDMRVREYLRFAGKIKGINNRHLKSAVDQSMEKASVTNMADKPCGQLSKGYRQRVGLAQALIHEPKYLILDEPTAGLDPLQIIEIRELIKSLAGLHTILLSTHILPEASQICKRVIIINDGRLVAIDSQEGLTRIIHDVDRTMVTALGPANEMISALEKIKGITSVHHIDKPGDSIIMMIESDPNIDIRADISRRLSSGEWPIIEMRPVSATLEEIFIHLTSPDAGGASS